MENYYGDGRGSGANAGKSLNDFGGIHYGKFDGSFNGSIDSFSGSVQLGRQGLFGRITSTTKSDSILKEPKTTAEIIGGITGLRFDQRLRGCR